MILIVGGSCFGRGWPDTGAERAGVAALRSGGAGAGVAAVRGGGVGGGGSGAEGAASAGVAAAVSLKIQLEKEIVSTL